MSLRLLGWLGFIFLAGGLLVMIFGPVEWRSFGCGAMITAVMIYGWGLWQVARMISGVRRRANDMLERVAQEMERRKNN